MNRRHFVQLSTVATAGLLFSRLTSRAGNNINVINMPDEVWAKSGNDWFQLKQSNGSLHTFHHTQVQFKNNGDSLGVHVSSPGAELNAIRLKWKHDTANGAKILGDHWERSYGDLAWKAVDAGAKNPWYVLLHDGRD